MGVPPCQFPLLHGLAMLGSELGKVRSATNPQYEGVIESVTDV